MGAFPCFVGFVTLQVLGRLLLGGGEHLLDELTPLTVEATELLDRFYAEAQVYPFKALSGD